MRSTTPRPAGKTRRPVCLDPETGRPPVRRKSRRGRWRALVLIGVHVLIAIHLAHWLTTGSTVSPLEPSEAMEFAKHSVVNAGLIFFGLATLATLFLGRWFCGWACHLVALQDLSRWILMRFGITPKPLRSRVLALVPLGAFLFMFVWPFVYRVAAGHELGPVRSELTRSDFWSTFPGIAVGVATFLVCGFGCVYLLGAKGFCTYACPYGALFGFADQFSPARIRVTDACEQCGHCTATCSSNVRVHEEVWRYGAVVDPGCMKCLDCVSVCPKDALYFGFGKPAVATRAKPERARKRRPALSIGEEAVLGVAFLAALATFYQPIPFLFALGLASALALLVLVTVRLFRRAEVSLLGWRLRTSGRLTRGGRVYAALFAIVALFWLHTGTLRAASVAAERSFQATGDLRPPVANPFAVDVVLSDRDRARAGRALRWSRAVDTLGLFPDGANEKRLSWLWWLLGDDEAAARHLDRALDAIPSDPRLRGSAAQFYLAHGEAERALALLREAVAVAPEDETTRVRLAEALLAVGRPEEAFDTFVGGLEIDPESSTYQMGLGNLEAARGNLTGAIERFQSAVSAAPERVDARINLGSALLRAGRAGEALGHLEEAVRLAPESPLAHTRRAAVLLRMNEVAEAREALGEALRLDPRFPEANLQMASLYDYLGQWEKAREHRERAGAAVPGGPGADPGAGTGGDGAGPEG